MFKVFVDGGNISLIISEVKAVSRIVASGNRNLCYRNLMTLLSQYFRLLSFHFLNCLMSSREKSAGYGLIP